MTEPRKNNVRSTIVAAAVLSLVAGAAAGVAIQWRVGILSSAVPGGSDPAGGDAGGEDHEGEGAVHLTEAELKEFGIEVDTVRAGTLHIEVSLPGEIVPDPDTLAHLVPRVGGIARTVKKNLGDLVEKGEVLAVIESRELADAKSTYLAALERLDLAKTNYEREERLWKGNISAEREYLGAKQALAEARINLKTAENKLHALGFSSEYLKTLPGLPHESYTLYPIEAPFTGTIIKKHLTLGEVVDNRTEIFDIADLTTVWGLLTVYQKDLNSVRKGNPARIMADKIDAEVSGVIDYVSPTVDEATRTATARVVIPNPDGRWRPGLFVRGLVTVEELDVGTAVLATAMQTIDGKTVVFAETAEGFEPVPVELGRRNRTLVEIVSGLKAGQRYAGTGAFTLKTELEKSSFGEGHQH